MSEPAIHVTKPYLPDYARVEARLIDVWNRRQLTNSGPYHEELVTKLKARFDANGLCLTNNGSIALDLALRACNLTGTSGEVITTPFTFAATVHSIAATGLSPVFADIDPTSFTIDPEHVESLITEKTVAIMAVHVYGFPADVDALERIAKKHDLALIYDAAHAFDVSYKGRNLLTYGEFSTLSFHATKVFNTFEGGAVVCRTSEGERRINRLKNFGIRGEGDIPEIGTNGKMSEFNAIVGLAQLEEYTQIRSGREKIYLRYLDRLAGFPEVEFRQVPADTHYNYAYFPLLICHDCSASRDEVIASMARDNIYPRRYFFPLLSNTPTYQTSVSAAPDRLPIANDISNRIMCLPLYPDMTDEEFERIIASLSNALGRGGE